MKRDRIDSARAAGRALRAALDRLERSDTRIKRRNARVNLRAVLRAVRIWAEDRYPMLDGGGTAIKRPKPKGRRCPACDAPMRDARTLARHAARNHLHDVKNSMGQKVWLPAREPIPGSYRFRCWCGRRGGIDWLARHLAAVKNLDAHAAIGAMGRADGS